MAKRKFRCVGMVRKTGKRVSAEIVAENEPAARQIAEQNGIIVDSLTDTSPVVAKLIEEEVEDPELMDRLDAIIRADGEELEGYLDDIGDDLTPPVEPATKACPFCGERILASAVKCKHCQEIIPPSRMTSKRFEQGQNQSKDFVNASVVTLLLYFVFWIPGIITNLIYLFDANRIKSLTGRDPAGRQLLLWLFWLCGVVPIVVSIVLIIFLAYAFFTAIEAMPTTTLSLPRASVPFPQGPIPAPVPAPVVEKHEITLEEIAFAEKLSAFLDGVDEMATMLEKVPKADECTKQYNALKTRFDAIPASPGAGWANDALASSSRIVELASLLPYSLTTMEVAMEALNQSAGDSPEMRAACLQSAAQIRQLVLPIRSSIPPECLAKPQRASPIK